MIFKKDLVRNLHHCVFVAFWLNICIIVGSIIFSSPNSFAEDRDKKEFWINKYGEIKESTLSIRAYEVFKRVLYAADRRVGIEPDLYIINFDGVPWAQSLVDGSIILTKNGLDFCYKNGSLEEGDGRLAFVIGHELAHQFNGDFWHYKFLRTTEDDQKSMEAFQSVRELAKDPDILLTKEIQADQYGIIYAVLAGYKSDEIITKNKNFFLEWAEKESSYTDSQDIDLLLKKRTSAVSMRLKEVADRIVLFQMGVISYRIGNFDDALSLFGRFVSYYPGREVYSNIGTIYLRLAYEKFLSSRTPESFPFLLSFGVDIKTRAETIDISRSGFTEDRYKEYKKLIEIAIDNLKKATEYDPFYQEAKNNLGCAYILENKYYDAISAIEEALKLTPNDKKVRNNLAVGYILLGQNIDSHHLMSKAEEILITAKEEDPVAKSNWDAFRFMEGKTKDIPLTPNFSDEQQRNIIINFNPSFELRPGMEVSTKSLLSIIEEISDSGKEVIKVLRGEKGKIFLLTRNNRIRLVLYKEPHGLKTDIKRGERIEIYLSSKGKKGVILSKNKTPDYFEF
jgi:tetratricopeptide (TPR) repeat protein